MWLLESNVLATVLQAEKSGFSPTAEQSEKFSAFHGVTSEDSSSRIMSIAGDTADIEIKGLLTNAPNILAMIFGGGNTTYPDIISAIAAAEQNESTKNIILSVDSPGGQIDGLFNAVNAIALAKKPVKAVVSNKAASAAFALVAQADEVVAVNEAARVGSVGIRIDIETSDNEVTITSTEAPKKAPDVTTAEGRATVREGLDAIHGIFASAIAKGRGTTVEKVNADFGQGGMVLAEEAIKRGMIDSISGSIPQASGTNAAEPTGPTASEDTKKDKTNANNGKNQREVSMDIEELKAQHPATFAAAVKLGVDQERDRVSAHLTMAEASGDMETAVAAVTDGSEMTATLNAKYMAAGMKKAELAARVGDNPDDLETPGGTEGKTDADRVADEVCAAMDYEEGGTA